MPRLSRIAALALLTAALLLLRGGQCRLSFPYHALPRPVWERELAHLKEMGVAHVSLPQTLFQTMTRSSTR